MLNEWGAVAAGALTFALAHAIEVVFWTTWFGGHRGPWFLNSSPAIAFTLGAVLVGSAAVAALSPPKPAVSGLGFAAGAALCMTIVLFVGPGPGNLFPIVLAFGGTLIVFASVIGAWLGGLLGGIPGRPLVEGKSNAMAAKIGSRGHFSSPSPEFPSTISAARILDRARTRI